MNDITHCIENCLETHRVCLQTVTHVLSNGGMRTHEGSGLVRNLLACADLCRVHADLMLMGSEYHPKMAEVCAEVCSRCAEECEHLGDDKLSACAQACHRSAESCRGMADTPVHAHAHSGARPADPSDRSDLLPRSSQGEKIGDQT